MMTTDDPNEDKQRRATDALPQQFTDAALGRFAGLHPAFADAHIETIDMDAALPAGHVHDEPPAASAQAAPPPIDKEQNRARLQIAKFRGSLTDFEVSSVTRVAINDVKRGDVIEIRTIVGNIFLSVVDRIKGLMPDTGEILCQCRYDLQNQWSLTHAASIILPVCTKSHVITNPDGSQRMASRALKITANTELPDQVKSLLRENFFTEIRIYANPQKERLRPIDIVRAVSRTIGKLKR